MIHSRAGLTAVAIASFVMTWCGPVSAQQKPALSVAPDAIGGQVTGANGPEAGVWVIAETTDLPTTKLAKTVVTDDAGRYLLPDLPKAKYKVWVRGYGLVDSPKVDAEPGHHIGTRIRPVVAVCATSTAGADVAGRGRPVNVTAHWSLPADDR